MLFIHIYRCTEHTRINITNITSIKPAKIFYRENVNISRALWFRIWHYSGFYMFVDKRACIANARRGFSAPFKCFSIFMATLVWRRLGIRHSKHSNDFHRATPITPSHMPVHIVHSNTANLNVQFLVFPLECVYWLTGWADDDGFWGKPHYRPMVLWLCDAFTMNFRLPCQCNRSIEWSKCSNNGGWYSSYHSADPLTLFQHCIRRNRRRWWWWCWWVLCPKPPSNFHFQGLKYIE